MSSLENRPFYSTALGKTSAEFYSGYKGVEHTVHQTGTAHFFNWVGLGLCILKVEFEVFLEKM